MLKSQRSPGFFIVGIIATLLVGFLVVLERTQAQSRRSSSDGSSGVISDAISPISRDGGSNGKVLLRPQANLLTDDFSYVAGTLLTANGWAAHSGAGTNSESVVAPGLTYTGYAGSGVGNAASMTVSGEDVNRAFTAQTSGSVYAGAMVNLSASQVNGDYFFHFIDGPIAGNQFKARVFAKKDPATTNFAFGVQKSSTANAVYTPFTFVPGTTYLIVVKYTIVAGAVNDTVDLFVNPVLNGVEPPPTLTATLGLDADAVDIEGVALRQGTAGNAATLTIDGIRVGTWTDVTGLATAADVSLSGRVMTADGRGITNAVVRVSGNSMAEPITVITGRRGTYFIDGLTGGETYVITVVSRRFAFSEPSRVITLNDNAFDQNFVAEGQ